MAQEGTDDACAVTVSEEQGPVVVPVQVDKIAVDGIDGGRRRSVDMGEIAATSRSAKDLKQSSFRDHMDYRHRKHFSTSKRTQSSLKQLNTDNRSSSMGLNSKSVIVRQTRRRSLDAAMEEASRISNGSASRLSDLVSVNSTADSFERAVRMHEEGQSEEAADAAADATALEQFLEEQFIFAALHGGSELDDRLDAVRSSEKHYDGDDLSLLFSSPILPLLRKRQTQAVLLLVALLLAALLLGAARSLAAPPPSASEFRFTATALRGGGDAEGPNVGQVTLTLDRCRVVESTMEEWREGRFLYLAFSRPVTINGLILATDPALPPPSDPAQFQLQAREAGGEWEEVGQRAWRQGVSLSVLKLQTRQELPQERAAETHVPLHTGLGWAVGNVAVRGVLAVGLGSVSALAAAGRYLRAKQLMAGVAALACALSLAAGAMLQATEGVAESAQWWLTSGYLAVLAASLLLPSLEVLFVPAVSACGLLELLGVLLDMALHGALERLALRLDLYVAGGLLVLGVAIMLRRRGRMRALQLSLGKDIAAYEEVWEAMVGDAVQQAELAELQNIVARSGKDAHPAYSPPVHHRVGSKAADGSERAGGAGQWDRQGRPRVMMSLRRSLSWKRHEEGPAVHSLDQVYAQAAAAHFILRRKLAEWALCSKGCVRLKPPPPQPPLRSRARRWSLGSQSVEAEAERQYVRYSKVAGRAVAEAQVDWQGLKLPQRAVAKALQLYQGDVSRVADVCREALYFNSVRALSMCLRTLLCDDEVALLRVKNTLDSAWPADLCAGFRYVKVNLRFRHELARSLGCHGHCVELLLVLRRVDRLRTAAAHQRFLHLRSVRDSSALPSAPLHVLSALLHCLRPRQAALAPRQLSRLPSMVSAGSRSVSASTGNRSSCSEQPEPSPTSKSQEPSALVCYADPALSPASLSHDSIPPPPPLPEVGSGVWGGAPCGAEGLLRAPPPQPFPALQAPQASGPTSGAELAEGAGKLAGLGRSTSDDAASLRRRLSASWALGLGERTQSEGRTASQHAPAAASLKRAATARSSGSGWLRIESTRSLTGKGFTGLLGMLRGSRRRAGSAHQDYQWTATTPSTREEETVEMMRRTLVRRCTREHTQLDREKERIADAMEAANAISVFTTSIPIAAALCKLWFRGLLVVVGLLFGWFAYSELSLGLGLGVVSFPLVRFTPLLLPPSVPSPTPLPPSAPPWLAAFGVLQRTCRRSLPVIGQEGPELTVGLGLGPRGEQRSSFVWSDSFADPEGLEIMAAEGAEDGMVEYNGFWLVTAEAVADGETVGFRVEGSVDGAEWEVLATPSGFVTQSNQRFWQQQALPAGLQRLDVDLRRGWETALRVLGVNGSVMLGCFSAVYCAAVHAQRLGKRMLSTSFFVVAIFYLIETVALSGRGQAREAGASLMYAVCTVMMASMLELLERKIFAVMIASGLLFLAARLVEDLLVVFVPQALTGSFPVVGSLLLTMGAVLICWKELVIRRSYKAIQQDNESYNLAWEQVWAVAEERRSLEAMGEQCRAYLAQHREGGKGARHTQRRRSWFQRRRSVDGPDRPAATSEGGGAETVVAERTPSFHLSATPSGRNRSLRPEEGEDGEEAAGRGCSGQLLARDALRQQWEALAAQPSLRSRRSSMSSQQPSLAHSAASEALEARAQELAARMEQQRAAALDPREASVVGRLFKAPSLALSSLMGSRTGAEAERGSEQALVRSLDQVYVQATGLHARVVEKVQHWALLHEGHFPVHVSAPPSAAASPSTTDEVGEQRQEGEGEEEGARFVAWAEVCEDAEQAKSIKWASLKRKGRAIEKLVRSYQGDVSRLVDVCRQAIVFRRCAAMQSCLTAILEDPDVSVCRIKNRMHINYDARETGGYRDLCLNLRMETEDTRRLCIDQHVFELQLVLMPFAELKNDEGHSRYVAFRNSRGE